MELFLLRLGCLLFNGNGSSWNGKASGKQVVERVFSTDLRFIASLWDVGLFESGEEILHGIEVINRWLLGFHFHFLLNFLWFLYTGCK